MDQDQGVSNDTPTPEGAVAKSGKPLNAQQQFQAEACDPLLLALRADPRSAAALNARKRIGRLKKQTCADCVIDAADKAVGRHLIQPFDSLNGIVNWVTETALNLHQKRHRAPPSPQPQRSADYLDKFQTVGTPPWEGVDRDG